MILGLNILVSFVILMSYFRYTLSETWITDLIIPDPDIKMLCENWITFYGFTYEAKRNRDKAISRNRNTDNQVFIWAASYAKHLATFTHNPMDNLDFCRMHGIGYKYYKHITLNDHQLSCRGWIEFHTYYNRNSEEIDRKLILIENRNDKEDIYNSIWATSYFRFINKNKIIMYPEQYCINIGIIDGLPWLEKKMPFMTINDTKMSCQQWIELHGFTNEVNENKNMVLDRESIYDEFINYWASQYIFHVRTFEKSIMTPKDYCRKILNKTTEDLPFE